MCDDVGGVWTLWALSVSSAVGLALLPDGEALGKLYNASAQCSLSKLSGLGQFLVLLDGLFFCPARGRPASSCPCPV